MTRGKWPERLKFSGARIQWEGNHLGFRGLRARTLALEWLSAVIFYHIVRLSSRSQFHVSEFGFLALLLLWAAMQVAGADHGKLRPLC